MKKIMTCLWWAGKFDEAIRFYRSVFKNFKVGEMTHYPPGTLPGMDDQPLTVVLELEDITLMLLNGGPQFQFTEAISLSIQAETQEEIDYYWEKLVSEGGEHGPCGWLKDKFGLSWQVAPAKMEQMLLDKDQRRAARVMQAMMQMKKIDLAKLEAAYHG